MERDDIKSRSLWSDFEIAEMLSIIKEKHIMKLLDSKTKRNKVIFQDVEKDMRLKGFKKNDMQIRAKFKSLKSDYYKIKRNNNTSGAQRQTIAHYDLLDEILCFRPVVAAEGIDTSLKDVSREQLEDCNFVVEVLDDMDEVEFISNDCDGYMQQNEGAPETSSQSIPNIAQSSNQVSASGKVKTFKNPKKRTYQKVVDSFTVEWKKSQDDLMNVLKAQDDKYFQNMLQQTRMEEEILKKHRKETERMLEKDRLETQNMLSSFLNYLNPPPFSLTPFAVQPNQQIGQLSLQSSPVPSRSSSTRVNLLKSSPNVFQTKSSYSSFASSVSTDENENIDVDEILGFKSNNLSP